MDSIKLSIKQWAEDDRPREKLLFKGVSALSTAELIAILLGSGTKELTAVELAQKIISLADNNLVELGKLTVKELTAIKGIGEAKAVTLLAAFELGRRRNASDAMLREKITHSRDVFTLFQPLLSDISHEEFWVALLNRSNKVIDKIKISQGGISGTLIDVRIIMKSALDKLASGIILCHNHPSGNKQPSESDKDITRKVKEAAKLLEISVLDHVIICDTGYFSFADEGLLI